MVNRYATRRAHDRAVAHDTHVTAQRQQRQPEREQHQAEREQRQAALQQRRAAAARGVYNLGRQRLDQFSEQSLHVSLLHVDPVSHRLTLGLMSDICEYCGARHFPAERTGGTPEHPSFGGCCNHGKVHVEAIAEYPAYLHALLNGADPISRHFRQLARQYNLSLQFASTGEMFTLAQTVHCLHLTVLT